MRQLRCPQQTRRSELRRLTARRDGFVTSVAVRRFGLRNEFAAAVAARHDAAEILDRNAQAAPTGGALLIENCLQTSHARWPPYYRDPNGTKSEEVGHCKGYRGAIATIFAAIRSSTGMRRNSDFASYSMTRGNPAGFAARHKEAHPVPGLRPTRNSRYFGSILSFTLY